MLSLVCMKAADPGKRAESRISYTAAEAAKQADIVQILINDEKQATL